MQTTETISVFRTFLSKIKLTKRSNEIYFSDWFLGSCLSLCNNETENSTHRLKKLVDRLKYFKELKKCGRFDPCNFFPLFSLFFDPFELKILNNFFHILI